MRILNLYLKEHKILGYSVLASLFIQAFVIISFQVAYKEIFDGVAEKKPLDFILFWIGVILIAVVLRILIGLLSDYMIGKITLKIFGKIRMLLFNHLQWLPSEFYQRVRVGEIVSHYSHDLQQSEMVTRQFLPLVIRSIFLAFVSFAILFYFNWRLTLFALALFPFVLAGGFLFMKRARSATAHNLAANAALSTMTEEVATQHMLLQAFNLQKPFFERFKSALEKYERQFLGGIFLRTLVGRTSVFGLSLVEILVFSAGALMTYHGLMSIGTLFGFFALVWNISGAVSTISDVAPNLIEAGSHMNRLQELLSEQIDVPAKPAAEAHLKKPALIEKITFNRVSLRHGEHEVLKDITLEILPGQHVGIVGATGSGKTSILSLLMGFYAPSEGEIHFNEQELRELDRDQLRKQIGIVFQHNPLFNQSLRDNIRIGKMDAADEEIYEAAKSAEIHDFIVSLPQGYDTVVKEYGSNLSGGQKQRIALARVYLRNPSLFLLDEPTSALDPLVESQVNQTIAKIWQGKTVVMSTHRLSVLTDVDHIYVLDKGELVEEGTYASLMEQKGIYYNLWQKQHTAIYRHEEEKPSFDLDRLNRIPLFQDLDAETLKNVSEKFVLERREEGSVISESEMQGKFYLIVRGKVEITSPDRNPLETSVRVLEEGDYFGISKHFANLRSHTKIVTLTYCIFLTLRDET